MFHSLEKVMREGICLSLNQYMFSSWHQACYSESHQEGALETEPKASPEHAGFDP